ncbi:Donson [Parasponia andersonii]|uniref:Donson n=1 Tax=Parasponia andersonii TaxID=3476 RepID=A0A2P5B810_PARAD|nr:Donson [Parasponia andersonii]
MAKVAKPSSVPSTSLQIGGGAIKVAPMVKRKTPSELRGEQLKRMNAIEIVDESPAPVLGSTRQAFPHELNNGLKKPELSRNPRYIDTHMDELYPAKKSRFRMLSGKENAKDVSMEQPSSLKNLSLLSSLAAKKRHEPLCKEKSIDSTEVAKDDGECQTTEKGPQRVFRSVTELSLGDDKSSGFANVDMNKALKGLAARETSDINGLSDSSSERYVDHTMANLGNLCLTGQKVPLDFTLKTSMQVLSSSSISWIQRSLMAGAYTGGSSFGYQFACSGDKSRSNSSGHNSTSQVFSSKIFHSWVYPQSTLPSSLISVLTSSAAEGVEVDFLRKRQVAWEDSFRSLYYMLRGGFCNIFYVCTPHFVVMFTGCDGMGRIKRLCNAYISQSTRSLRALLREHDVCFSMPLCHSKVEQVTTEDLVELSEIEKQNLGQTRRLNSSSDIDNTPESLLVFNGNKNAHGLYDILLNYRSFLTALAGMDVPLLYSPLPFQNAAFSAPEVKCMELKRAEHISTSDKVSTVNNESQRIPSGFCSSVEIKDAYIPPWIICSICAVMGSEGKSFEARFSTEPTSTALNAAVEVVNEKPDIQAAADEGLKEASYAFGIPEALVAPQSRSGLLKALKYSDGSYTATLSPITSALIEVHQSNLFT